MGKTISMIIQPLQQAQAVFALGGNSEQIDSIRKLALDFVGEVGKLEGVIALEAEIGHSFLAIVPAKNQTSK